MNLHPHHLVTRIRRKAESSLCNYRVVAVGLDKTGVFIGIKSNAPRPNMSDPMRDSYHAEERLIHSSPPTLKTVLIARIGKGGVFRPIDPCPDCLRLAEKRGIVIKPLDEAGWI